MNKTQHDARRSALAVVRELRDAGYVALLAGGCVRDMLLNRTPKDFDVVTDARPEQVQRVFPRAKAVGKQFGVMLVHRHGVNVDVATFRSDGPYGDGRRPDHVEFGSPAEDARRRDFTINGMFHDPTDQRLIDHVGGQADLQAKLIRTIGDPGRRFCEDHLRMLRAVRFAADLDFVIDPPTLEAIRENAGKLSRISAERIWMELERIIVAPSRARGWQLLRTSGLDRHLVDGWTWLPAQNDAVIARLAALPSRYCSAPLAIAALLYDRSAAQARRFGRRLRQSNECIKRVDFLVSQLPRARAEASLELADIKTYAAHPGCEDLLALLRADLCAQVDGEASIHERLAARIRAIDPAQAAPSPLLTGDDLLSAGISAGPRFSPVLKTVYRAQLNQQIHTADEAMSLARRLLSS